MLEHTCIIIVALLVTVVSGDCNYYNNYCNNDSYTTVSPGLAIGILVVIYLVPLIFWVVWLVVAIIGYAKYDWQIGASLLVFFFGFFGLSCALAMQKRSQVFGHQSGAVVPPGGPYVVYTSQQYQQPGPGAPGAYAYAQHPGAPGVYVEYPGAPGAYAQHPGTPGAYGPGVIHAQPVPQYGNGGVPSYEVGAQPPPPPPKYQ